LRLTEEKSAQKGTRTVLLVVSGDVNEGSPNKRLHWAARAALDQRWQEKAAVAWLMANPPPFTGKAQISFVIYRGRELDHCNVLGSRCLKALIDGFKGRAFEDDSPRYLRWGKVRQVTGKEYRDQPAIEIIIEEVKEEGDLVY